MKFVDFLNESVKKDNAYAGWNQKQFNAGIENGEIVVVRSGVSPFYLYKGFKSVHKKSKTDEDFISFIEKASSNVDFEEASGKNELIDLCKEVVDDAKTMKAPELKLKWEKIVVPANDEDGKVYLALDSTLTTSTGNTGWKWNLYELDDLCGFIDKYGRVAIGVGLKLNEKYHLVHNDRLESMVFFTPVFQFENATELKKILSSMGFATFSRAYTKATGNTSTRIYSLKTYITPSQYAKISKS